MCKHLAAVLYGIGARLDQKPELFFILRGIDPNEFLGSEVVEALTDGVGSELPEDDLSNIFGVEFDTFSEPPVPVPAKKSSHKVTAKKTLSQKASVKKVGSPQI